MHTPRGGQLRLSKNNNLIQILLQSRLADAGKLHDTGPQLHFDYGKEMN